MENATFGISKIEIRRPGIPMSLQSCSSAKNSGTNRFGVEEVSYVNISFLKPYNLALDYVEKSFGK